MSRPAIIERANALTESSFIKAVTVKTNYDFKLANELHSRSTGLVHHENGSFFWGAFEHEDPMRIWMVGLIPPGEA